MNALFETIDGSVFIGAVKTAADELVLGRRHFYRCYGNTAPLLYSESISAALYHHRLSFGGFEDADIEELTRRILGLPDADTSD